mgnify:CR=1 FL=1
MTWKSRIYGDVEINGEKVGHSSPQDPLLNDIVNEVGSDTTYISKITKIVLVDSGGTERDSTESLDYTDNTGASPPEVAVHGVIDITENYTVASVRLYAGTKLYFETAWSKAVEAGDKVEVTVTIRMEVTGSLSGTTTGSLGSAEGLIKNVLKALIGVTRNQVGFHFGRITGVVDTTIVELVKAEMSRTVDLANNKVTGDSGLITPAQAGDGIALEFLNVNNNLMASFSFDASVPITSEVQLQITFEFTVS